MNVPLVTCMAEVEALIRLVGPGGFHPDTPGADYVQVASGTATFTAAEADQFDAALREADRVCAQAGTDLYEVGLRLQAEERG